MPPGKPMPVAGSMMESARGAEVAAAFGHAGHGGIHCRAALPHPAELLGPEEEGLAAVAVVERQRHGAAQRVSEIVQPERKHLVREVVAGIQRVVAEKLVHGAAKLLAAALGDHVDLGEPAAPVFGGESGSHDLELRNRFDGGEGVERAAAYDGIGVARAVDIEALARRPRTVDLHGGPGVRVGAVGHVGGHAGHQFQQRHERPPVELKLAHLLAGNQAALIGALRLHLFDVGHHGDLLRQLADLQGHVYGEAIADVQLDAGAHGALEAGLPGRNLVDADGKVHQGVAAVRAGFGGPGGAGFGMNGGYLGARNGGAGAVHDGARDAARGFLGGEAGRRETEELQSCGECA